MRDEDADVAIERWEAGATPTATTVLPQAASAFAREHGMGTGGRDDLRRAVSEAVADAVDRGAQLDEARVVVDAATDGHSLSVRISGDAQLEPGRTLVLPLVASLAQRAEQNSDEAGTTVLMEFDIPPRAARRPARACPRAGRPSTRRRGGFRRR